MCDSVRHNASLLQQCEEFDRWCLIQGIDKHRFINDIQGVLKQEDPKINTLWLEGVSNSGKTLVTSLATEHLFKGYTTSFGIVGKSEFEYQDFVQKSVKRDRLGHNIANTKEVLIISELYITPLNFQGLKQLLGGETLAVNIKHKDAVLLERTPCIVTTNHSCEKFLKGEDIKAILNRVHRYVLLKEFKPNCNLCSCGFKKWQELTKP